MKIICKDKTEMYEIVGIFADNEYCPTHFGGKCNFDCWCKPRKNQTQVEVCESCWYSSGLIEVIS